MSDTVASINGPYLQAAAAQAASYHQAIWQKMGFILAIQYGSIAAAYILRNTYLAFWVIVLSFLFSWGVLWAIDRDVRRRKVLIDQVNFIARDLEASKETVQSDGLTRPFQLDPFPIANFPFITISLKVRVIEIPKYLTWLRVRLALLAVFDLGAALTLTYWGK